MRTFQLYKGQVMMEFDSDKHIFYVSGQKIGYSVTGIVNVIDKSAALMGWSVKMMGEYLIQNWKPAEVNDEETKIKLIIDAKNKYREIKQEAADIGQAIHEWIHQHILGKEKPELPENPQILNGVLAYLKWRDVQKIKFLEIERPVFSKKYGYAGFLDGVAKIGKELVMIDFKSSNGFWPEFDVQTAGYAIAYEEEVAKKIDYRLVIRFGKETGDFAIKELRKNKQDKEAFLACLRLKKWLNNQKS